MSRPLRETLPQLPVVFGLPEPEAAAAVGISVSEFRVQVADGPKPRRIDGRCVYDVDELRSSFKDLPPADEAVEADTWSDVA